MRTTLYRWTALIVRVSGIAFLMGTLFVNSSLSREIASQRECTTCHVMWLDELKQETVKPLIDAIPMNKIMAGGAALERICLSCHDGFVLDSRFVWTNRENFHPLGVTPSEKISIPVRKDGTTVFPMDMNGKVYCGTCHSAHGRKWESENERDSPIFLRVSNKDSQMCMTCHIDRATGPAEGNHPVNRTSIDLPQIIFDAGGKRGVIENQIICQSCHRVHGAASRKLLVLDNTNSALCGTCHSDRYAKDKVEANMMRTHPVNIVSQKVKIADEILEIGGRTGTNGEIICQTCHRPHYAIWNNHLLIKDNSDSKLCRTCHPDKGSVLVTKHNMNISNPNETNALGKTVADSGPCSACHVPHRGKGPRMWARVPFDEEDPVAKLCRSCHSDGKVAQKKQTGRYSHPTLVSIKGADGKTVFPLFDREGVFLNASTEGFVSCPTCHNAHQWDSRDASKGSGKNTEGDNTNSFLRKQWDADSTLCMECHSDKKITGSDHDLRVTAKREKNILGRAVGESGICSACHLPHNGNSIRMWSRELNTDDDPVSRLCRSCHSEGRVASAKQVGRQSHPTGRPISKLGIKPADRDTWFEGNKIRFGNSSSLLSIRPLPLFDDEGRRTAEGSIACASCHNPHQWDPGVVADGPGKNIEGDGGNSFLRMANNPGSNLCKNCHYQRSVAFSKHNMAITAPDEKNIAGNNVSQTGTCSACHLPHNGNSIKMWARNVTQEGDNIYQLCISCHSKGNPAEKKTIGEYYHPLNAPISLAGGVSTLPLIYDTITTPMKDARVVCSSCHNVHQWYANDPNSLAGARKNVEGDINNSFLRIAPTLDAEICTDCHRDKRPVKRTKHDMNLSAPKELNLAGQSITQSGTCGVCHSVHNAKNKYKIWGRFLGEGDSLPERRCRSCHASGEIGDKKVPKNFKHPKEVIASNVGRHRPGDFPLYDKNGVRKDAGIITCPTCHDPHVWSAANPDFGPGKMTEGNINNSFLRNLSPSILCTDCHGRDAIFRYKYFHADTSRQKYPLYGTGN